MMKTREKLFGRGCSGAFHVGGRRVALLLALALGLLAPQGAKGYPVMDNDRILLMNNDAKWGASITSQGYYDTDTSAKTYWVHDATSPGFAPNLLKGTNHTLFKNDGTKLWQLVNCRAGSGTVVGSAARNYIPWTVTAKSIIDGTTRIPVTSAGAKAVGSVILRNSDEACVYSPYYEEGIGTIYFDAVNAFTDPKYVTGEISLEIATNVTSEAQAAGSSLKDADDDFNVPAWTPCPFDLFAVADKTTVTMQSHGVTNAVMASTAGEDRLFYRIRAHLNHYGPIRFRIRRLNQTGGNADTTGLILLDNIIASYPPMTFRLNRYGEDYDEQLGGADVLGCVGDFTSALVSQRQQGVKGRAWVRAVTNAAAAPSMTLKNPRIVWRWRYLNQKVTEERTLPLGPETSSLASLTEHPGLLSTAALPLDEGVGDIEYFFVAEQNAPYYALKDYALGSVFYGDGWSEAITSITNRAHYVDETPACGHDYFVRIREAESPCEWVKLCTSVTTNGTEGVKREDVRMELVGTNTWRYCYYVPTNAVGETLRFHFEGKKLFQDPDDPFKYAATTNVWRCDLSAMANLPYTSVAGEGYGNDVAVTLDGASTHLVIEFNDDLLSYSVSHGTYQNFNTWTDALVGYRGNAKYDEENPTNGASATGVSDTKQKFTAEMANWPPQGYSNPYWTENFNTHNFEEFPLYTPFDSPQYPKNRLFSPQNQWSVGHGQWIRGVRGSAAMAAANEEVALQLEGRGQGYVALDKDSGMPAGIGTVSFAARVAQEPRFDDFAVYGDGPALTDYAISAKITMSRERTSNRNPTDISPSQPSVSLVGRYREKKGCYEYRVSRTASDQLTCALYKWKPSSSGMVAHLLASNVITSAEEKYAFPGPGQEKIFNFQNMLVPEGTEDVNRTWTSAYLFVFNTRVGGPVYIECTLSSSRNTNDIGTDRGNLKKVLKYTDADEPFPKGSYGVGSTDCNAAFGGLLYHLPANAGDYSAGINYKGEVQLTTIAAGDWAFYADRWRQITSRESSWGASGALGATMPSNQTIRLQFKDDASGWFDSGYEVPVSSFSTNRYEFAPCVSKDYKVRLIAGGHSYDEVRTDVVVDDVEITAWRAADFPSLGNTGTYAQGEQWVYTAGTVESAFAVTGPGEPAVAEAGTNGYVFTFSRAGVYTLIPQMDMEIDRMLLVGGGGAGGWTLGGGGGGGGVRDLDLSTNTVLLAKGEPVYVTVGGGGDNYYVKNNDWQNWKTGGNGGLSSIVFRDANTGRSTTYEVKGGGGGMGWDRNPSSGQATGGGGAKGDNDNYNRPAIPGTAGQGSPGGRAYGDRAGGGGGAALDETGPGQDGTAEKDGAGDGGAGRASDITGAVVYYGGGGGGGGGDGSQKPNSASGGGGGKGGGGTGLDAKAQSRPGNLDGVDGLGGGGGGGSHGGATGTQAGGRGGCGTVILRARNSSMICTLQPARGTASSAMGLRSPYLGEGLSMLSFNYANADSNCVLLLQTCIGTNGSYSSRMQGLSSMTVSLTREPPATNNFENANWITVTNFSFKGMTEKELLAGTRTHYMSLRAPVLGFMRLVMAPEVIAQSLADEGPDRDVDYGKITITRISCYNEPALDLRSWWGWNLHTEGWNTEDKQYAYLFDSPEGLSGSLNFSALRRDNETVDARGIGLAQPELETEYQENNSFVQCPPLTNGIGTVTFRARTFTTNQTQSSYLTLFGTSEPDSYQVDNPQDWTALATFEITNTTYQTYRWATTDDNTKVYAIRLEVNGSRHGRVPANPADWEKPPVKPIQRVWVDEITASEPIVPRLVFRDVRPFRSHIGDIPAHPVTNVTDLSEQPILGESWGIQATVEPQQMSDELDASSVVVYASFYRGVSPWGYDQWKDRPAAITVQLEKVSSNLVFRSTYNNAASVIGPDMTPNGIFPNNVWQYYVWAEYKDRQGIAHVHGLDATEWGPPSWFYGIKNLNETYGSGLANRFAGYTILDSISPQRAWLNEVNICDTGTMDDYANQFIEIAVPQGADLTDWRIDLLDRNVKRGTIARFGSGNARVTSKTGSRPGVDATNYYTFVALRSPAALLQNRVPEADGSWMRTPTDSTGMNYTTLSLIDGNLRNYEAYGLALVRPSGVIEHQIIFSGTNTYLGGPLEYLASGTNLLAKAKAADGPDSHWFFAGEDMVGGTLGVFRSHGEDASCWTNQMIATAAALNRLADGTPQDIDGDWFLQPNGTNVWIYSSVLGAHISQKVGSNTNRTAVVIIRKGDSTNIVYTTAPWYQIGEVKTNDVVIAEARGRGSRSDRPAHTWTLQLKDVQETVNVTVDEEPSKDVVDAGLSRDDPYYNAIMAWLTSFGEDLAGIYKAEQWDLANRKTGDLDIRDMYWLNIDPTTAGWVLKAGMGGLGDAAVAPVPYEDETVGSLTNVRMVVTMMITNRLTNVGYAPDRIQGLEPGSSSYAYDGSSNWTSATFKICGALQKEGVQDKFYPLRWFVFGPDSFDVNCEARIEISDPHAKSSPGYFNGWHDFPDLPVFYKWMLNAEPPAYDTTEMLKADSTYP